MWKSKGLMIFVALALLISVAGWGRILAADERPADAPENALGKVNGTYITSEIHERHVQKQITQIKQAYGVDFTEEGQEAQLLNLKQRVLEQLLRNELLLQVATDLGIQISDEVIQGEIDAIKANYVSEEAFQQVLESVDYTMEELRQDITLQKSYEQIAEQLTKELEITEEDLQAYYEENLNRFSEGDQVRASHILVDTEEKAIELLEELKNGADFAETAKTHSTGPSNVRGGDLGFFSRGQMVQEFEEAAFSMEVGQLSEPVQTQFGWHIIKVTDKKDAVVLSFEEVEEDILAALTEKSKSDAAIKYLEGRWSEAEVEYYVEYVVENPTANE